MSTQTTTTALGSIDGVGVVGATSDAQTEDQVLGLGTEDNGTAVATEEPPAAAASDTTGENTADVDGKPQPAAGEAKPAGSEAASAATSLAIPKELTALFKDPAVGPKLQAVMPAIQQAFDQRQAFVEAFGTVAEARSFREAFPGGAEEARAVREKADILEEADDQFTGSAQDQLALAEEWAEEYPEAFGSMVVQAANVLQQRDPQTFARVTEQVFRDRMAEARWDEQFEAIGEAIRVAWNQDHTPEVRRVLALASWLVQDADKRGIAWNRQAGRVNPELQTLERERAAAARESANATAERMDVFTDAVNTSVESNVNASIAKTLGQLLKDTAFSPKGKERIQTEVFQEIDRRLKADKSIQRQYKQLVRQNGRLNLNAQTRKQVAEMIVGKARAMMTKVARDIIQGKTEELIAQNTATNDKKTVAGQRPDVSGGAPPAVRTRKLTPKDVEGMTDDEIMNL